MRRVKLVGVGRGLRAARRDMIGYDVMVQVTASQPHRADYFLSTHNSMHWWTDWGSH